MRLIQVISDFIRRSILTNDDDMVIRSGGVPTRIPLSDVRDHAPNAHATSHKPGGSDELSSVGGVENTVARVIYPGGGSAYFSGNTTGAIRIKMPGRSQQMYNCVIVVYNYITDASFLLYVSGYMYLDGPRWTACSANLIGNSPQTDIVRFCRNSDSSEWYIVVGDTTTSWAYTGWQILHASGIHYGDIDYIKSGWEITQITTLPPNIDVTIHADAGNAGTLEGHPASYFLEASRPAFRARLTGDATDVTGDGTWFDMSTTTWSEDYDINSNFSNGVFTAPVNGIYSFGGVLALTDITTDMTAIILDYVLNSTNYFLISVSASVNDTGSVLCALPYNFDVQLSAGDTVKLKVLVDGGTKVVNVETDDTFFYGRLEVKT